MAIETEPSEIVPSIESPDGRVIGASSKAFRARIERCKTKKRNDLISDWKTNVDYRRGKVTSVDSDDNRSSITADWSLTKAKVAQMFSQVPKVVVTGEGQYKIAAPVFEKRLNKRLTDAKVGAAMDEVFPDVVNAAGIGAVVVTYEARTEKRQVPAQPFETLGMLDRALIMAGLKQQEMIDQPFITDRKFSVTRISPGDFLWPVEFTGSDFDQAPWLGRSGRMTWAEAQLALGLTDDQQDKVLGDHKQRQDHLSSDTDTQTDRDDDVVMFDEIHYWRYLYHSDEKYFSAIQRMVFVDGIVEPVINEPWKGQEFDQEIGSYIGACRFPERVLTLNYISDEAIPPSDSAMGRTLVKDLARSRDHVFQQRDFSKPMRWYNVDRIDADIQTAIMQGDWQGMFPTQGSGERAIGEVARSAFPRENMEFDRDMRTELREAWSIGPNQMGTMASGERSAAEAKITQGNFSAHVSQERARGVALFLGIADVMAGLMSLYDDFELPNPEDQKKLQMWDRKRIRHELVFSIRGDSTVALDANQRIDRGLRVLNELGKSGYLKPLPIIEELVALSGFDPSECVGPPEDPGPEPPNVSFRFSGSEDLSNPMAVAILMESKMAPTPEKLQAAIALIRSMGGVATIKLAGDKDEVTTTMHVDGEPLPQPQMGGPGGPPGSGGVPMSDDRPEWQSIDRVNSRRDASQN